MIFRGTVIFSFLVAVIFSAQAQADSGRIRRISEVLQVKELSHSKLCLQLRGKRNGESVDTWVLARRNARGINWRWGSKARLKAAIACEAQLERSLGLGPCICAGKETKEVTLTGNLDSRRTGIDIDRLAGYYPTLLATPAGKPDSSYIAFMELQNASELFTTFEVIDTLGEKHSITAYFFKDESVTNSWVAALYARSDNVDAFRPEPGEPRLLGYSPLLFDNTGTLTSEFPVLTAALPWNNGSEPTQTVRFNFSGFTQISDSLAIDSRTIDGSLPTECE